MNKCWFYSKINSWRMGAFFVILVFIVDFLCWAFWMLFLTEKNESLSCLSMSPRVEFHVSWQRRILGAGAFQETMTNSGASIVGSNTTGEMKMLKDRTDKESFDQMVHPDNPLEDLRKGQECLHGCWGFARRMCSLWNFISLQPLNAHFFEKNLYGTEHFHFHWELV